MREQICGSKTVYVFGQFFCRESFGVSLLPRKTLLFYTSPMDIDEFDAWCRSFLRIEDLKDIDDSLNGIQVGRKAGPLRKVAFAVDACAESIRRAGQAGADALFVHHGLFWGKPLRIEGALLERLRLLLSADIALYACHLPLDMHEEIGNNAVLADLLSLGERRPFGLYRGIPIGVAGRLPEPLSLEQIVRLILPEGGQARNLIAAGPEKISSVAVVSGGAAFEAFQAFGQDVDLYITGEPSHSIYHHVVENGLNFVAAGHYATETWGVKALAQKLKAEKAVETLFIDIPTGL